MARDNCYRIGPGDTAWLGDAEGATTQRELFASDVVALGQRRSEAGGRWMSAGPSLYLITDGQLSLDSGQILQPGDLHWSSAAGEELTGGNRGTTFYVLEPKQSIGQELPPITIHSAQVAWEKFDDPAGRPTQPVQVLLEGSLSVLRTRFDPNYIAGEHWHDFDTLYFITDGRMQFGDEGWFEQGDIRAVHGGHSYGPERPGVNGVEFVLVSIGGPVALHWSDLEPPP